MGLDFSVVPAFAGVLFTGALWTIAITLSAAVLSFFGGIVFAVIALYAPLGPMMATIWPFCTCRLMSFSTSSEP